MPVNLSHDSCVPGLVDAVYRRFTWDSFLSNEKKGNSVGCPLFLFDMLFCRLVRSPLDLRKVDAFLDHLVQRAELAEFEHHVDDLVRDIINFGLGIEAAESEADGAVRYLVAQAKD